MSAMTTVLLAAAILLAGAAGYGFWSRRRLLRQIREIGGKIETILDQDTEEKVMDFTDSREIGHLLAQVNRILEDRQRMKADYRRSQLSAKQMLSNISHDIKTPLTVILGYLEMMRGDFGENAMVCKVEQKAEQVLELINKFFTLAKIESGDMDLQMERVDLCEVCRRNLLDFYEILTEKEFQVEPGIPQEPMYVYGDENALDRIFFNLLSNAVRYGEDGKYLGIGINSVEDEVRVTVTDKGKGIPPEHLEQVFTRLYTQEDSRNRQLGGNGLGLAIVKSLAEKMGGSVEAASTPGEFTVFTLHLPRIPYPYSASR